MAYEQGWKKFQGIKFQFAWLDEEPYSDVWSQVIRGTIAQKKSRIAITMTPEEGFTGIVDSFLNQQKLGQAVVTATWEDAAHDDDTDFHKKGDTHLSAAMKEQKLAAMQEWERDMRSKGIPLMGSGLVWPMREEDIKCDPREFPDYFVHICACDFGVDHPFAAVWMAWDRDLDIVYVYDCYRRSRATIAENAAELRKRGPWIPVIWPHDGNQEDPKSSRSLAELYRQEGANMWFESFTNPPAPGQKKGDIGVEAGIKAIWERMQSERFFVFRTLDDWFEEFRMYHRKDGKVVPFKDDLMSATRYAHQSLRHARLKASHFGKPIQYSNRGIV
jgi:phage terminase large subunit-like protein